MTNRELIKTAFAKDCSLKITKDSNGTLYSLQTFSDAGQDFYVELYCKGIEDFIDKLEEYADDFDVSEETYRWLDSSGHGKNGAPYDMEDVYKDMEKCRDKINELVFVLRKEA